MNFDYELAFWFLAFTGLLNLLGIIVSAKGLSSMVKSDFFIDKMKELRDKDGLKTIIMILMTTIPGAIWAESIEAPSKPYFEIGFNEVMMMLLINLILFAILLLLKRMIKQLVQQISPPVVKKVKEKSFSGKLVKSLSGMVDIEEEESILMDHDYDGIQELDNNLPPWWKYGFYLTIVVSFLYMFHFHVLGTGDLQIEEYQKEMTQAQADVDEYLSSSALNVDENTAVMMTAAGDLGAGKGIFIKNCAVCHLEDGGGQVGPNMTDDYWIYGPDMKNIFKTIKYGANNGMTSWKEKLTPIEIQQVASYMRTLHGTTPAIPKDPEGTLMPFDDGAEVAATDSTLVE